MSLTSITLGKSKEADKILVSMDWQENEEAYAYEWNKGIERALTMAKAARMDTIEVSVELLEELLSK